MCNNQQIVGAAHSTLAIPLSHTTMYTTIALTEENHLPHQTGHQLLTSHPLSMDHSFCMSHPMHMDHPVVTGMTTELSLTVCMWDQKPPRLKTLMTGLNSSSR